MANTQIKPVPEANTSATKPLVLPADQIFQEVCEARRQVALERLNGSNAHATPPHVATQLASIAGRPLPGI